MDKDLKRIFDFIEKMEKNALLTDETKWNQLVGYVEHVKYMAEEDEKQKTDKYFLFRD